MSAHRDQLKIFVGGLAQHTTKQTLDQYFAQFGYADSYIMMEKATGRSRGFGFVNFTDQAVMEAVLQMAHEVDGVSVTVSPYAGNYNPKGGGRGGGGGTAAATSNSMGSGGAMETTAMLAQVQQQLTAMTGTAAATGGGGGGGGGGSGDNQLKIFVGGLAQHTTKESLDAYFSQFGHADSYVMMDKATGRSRGFGFVNFADEQVMNLVMQYSHEIDGTIITVSPYEAKGAGKGGGGGGDGGGCVAAAAGGGMAANANGIHLLLSNVSELVSKLQTQLLGQEMAPQAYDTGNQAEDSEGSSKRDRSSPY